MVIQREMAAPIWGWADPGERIAVEFAGQTKQTVAAADGTWRIDLDPLAASTEPRTLTVRSQPSGLQSQSSGLFHQVSDVLVGDVWLCSGQSNMRMNVRGSLDADAEIASAKYPGIRLFQVQDAMAGEPQADAAGQWQLCNPSTVAGFSATGYYFGRKLHQELNVPIGLVASSWGGTPIESWTSAEAAQEDQQYAMRKSVYDNQSRNFSAEQAQATFERQVAEANKKIAVWKANGKKGPPPFKPSKVAGHPQTENPKYPSSLYNGMIHPLAPFGLKGAIWYQGEANAGAHATYYRVQLENLITSWRALWGQGDFPFYFVQLPNYRLPWTEPVENGGWPDIRESFMLTAKEVPNTGMAITIDIGEAGDIHPKNKQDVGDRLGRVALYQTYGQKDIVWSGPIITEHRLQGDKAYVKFETGGAPLAVQGDVLKGFAIMTADGDILTADAEILSKQAVVVTAAGGTEIRAVFYAWADNPVGANLINEAGLPASPFRFGDYQKLQDSLSNVRTLLRDGSVLPGLQHGAVLRSAGDIISGEQTHTALFVHPSFLNRKVGAVSFDLELQDVRKDLRFALAKATNVGDGILLKVLCSTDGSRFSELADIAANNPEWQTHTLSLSKWHGQNLTLRFIIDPGATTVSDGFHIGDLTLY
jgi:sialate O-acetylesterase